ncbi:recombination-associated protein RdgC [Denitromonas ohlonensis]|jgi:recombination associated protein RdgC|uniref:Recombination-associated protein RdgC n=2 Tax=Denitromonas TaxID=139331 RepID=A0A558EFR3_9RHOO|nr:recombination-associated protein RdgC [Denitromonas ohlonensis]TVT51220.1 MAG: recombination-associated protein RdgC [Denitromonas halophila]TVO67410.1 recombination-associated protein RdgC [Denitromonas ohlonensis]TVO72029.1 recombination-associated protein RdgC [Denitromonas ohlonensis]TVT72150.1 MAG: recombination-associated protein RdgC [Denitromonas halophila]TVT74310.1 MAG: recombination-associated protein RdgC [Denitromonas halophila]
MWFRNLQLYRLPVRWDMRIDQLEDQLARRAFTPCGSQDPESRGWLPPVANGPLVHAVGGQWLIALGIEHRLLPSSVVKQEAEERAARIELEQGFKPGRKQMKDLRDEVTQEFMPRAFTRRNKVYAWIDPQDGWLAVDVASVTRAEDILEALRQSLDAFPLTLVRTELSPVAAMSDWLAGGDVPGNFTIDMDCELKSVTEDKAAVRYVRHSLDGDEIKTHLQEGKLPTKLALTWNDRVSFLLTEKGEIKRLQFLDVVQEEASAGSEDAAELFDAHFALMTGELRQLIPAVIGILGGELATPAV